MPAFAPDGFKRLVIIGPTHPYKGGIAQHTTLLAHVLSKAGHEVQLWSWTNQYPKRLYPGQLHLDQPEIPPHPNTEYLLSWNRPLTWWRVGHRLRRTPPDAAFFAWVTPLQGPAYTTLLRSARSATRFVAICHNVLPHERRRFDRSLTHLTLESSDALVVHTEAEARIARQITTRPLHLVPLPPLFLSSQTLPPSQLKTQRPRKRVLFFGTVRPYKGLDVLLRAIAATPNDVNLTVAGELWESETTIRRLIHELGIDRRVELRSGYVSTEEIEALFGRVDALILPYLSASGTANVKLAFRHGVPVVATRVGDLPQQVDNGVDGLLVPPGDAGALAQAIRRLYAPAFLSKLRSGVPNVDPDGQWARYLEAVLAAARG